MQPPSRGRQPGAFDVSSGYWRRTQAHSRYGFRPNLTAFSPFQGGCHGGGGLGGVEWIASYLNGGWRLNVSLPQLTSGKGNVVADLPEQISLPIIMNQYRHRKVEATL